MAVTSTRVLFSAPGCAELNEFPRPVVSKPGDVLIETEYSIVSAGTELACLTGTESWAPLPFVPGYGSVGRVVETGSETAGFSIGQRVFTFGPHARHALAQPLILPVPDRVDPALAVFARMASVAITSVRVAQPELGDYVAVVGLGLVGNLAAQLLSLAGCTVIGIDLSAVRRDVASRCGVAHAIAPGDDLRERVAELTGGEMCSTVVEATGNPRVAETVAALAGRLGQVILLGSPRGRHETDLTGFLNNIHLWERNCVTFKGAHEWRYPVRADSTGIGKHSMERNLRQLLRMITIGRLKIEPLLTHRAAPADCQKVYDGLRTDKDAYLGVVFDWRAL